MGKFWITASLVLCFILGFAFKHYLDFRFLEKMTGRENKGVRLSEMQKAQISGAILSTPQNIPPTDPVITINDVIHAQEEEKPYKNTAYLTPDQNPNFLPIRDWSVPFTEFATKAAIVTDQDASKIFYQKNISEKLPIASLTKLMTAIIVVESKNLDDVVKISQQAVNQEGNAGKLAVDEEITIGNLLKALLIESSNDAAFALEEYFSSKGEDLIGSMNQKAISLNLTNTHFSSTSGLIDKNNYSTAYDYARLISYSLSNNKIWNILKTSSSEIRSVNNSTIHRLINSNILLGRVPGLIGGKTGYTEEARGCLLTVTDINDKTRIISVIIGSDDRFGEMEKLINWVKKAYRFN
jgi:D-alanyl-D-alanine carboxypeptidase